MSISSLKQLFCDTILLTEGTLRVSEGLSGLFFRPGTREAGRSGNHRHNEQPAQEEGKGEEQGGIQQVL
jgi:hypothetical protein